MVDFETPASKLYLLPISADNAQEKRKEEQQVLLPTVKVYSPYSTLTTLSLTTGVNRWDFKKND
jgi:hypothetical protein